MPLLDQFRRPDRGQSPPSWKEQFWREQAKAPEHSQAPASATTAVAEDSLPNHAGEEDAA